MSGLFDVSVLYIFFTISVAVSAEESKESDRLEAKVGLGVMFIDSGNNTGYRWL